MSAMQFVPATPTFLQKAITFFGLVYILSFFTFIGLLVYAGHAGVARPDATHTVRMTDHGRTYYPTTWQSESRLWAGVTTCASGLVTVLSSALVKRGRRF